MSIFEQATINKIKDFQVLREEFAERADQIFLALGKGISYPAYMASPLELEETGNIGVCLDICYCGQYETEFTFWPVRYFDPTIPVADVVKEIQDKEKAEKIAKEELEKKEKEEKQAKKLIAEKELYEELKKKYGKS